jgi:hypothetical protein
LVYKLQTPVNNPEETCNIQNKAKVWNKEHVVLPILSTSGATAVTLISLP